MRNLRLLSCLYRKQPPSLIGIQLELRWRHSWEKPNHE
jgi:hypothetical protein